MANMKPVKFSASFTMRADEEFFADLDDMRVQERPVLSRAEYLRKLVREAKTARKKRK